MSEANGGAPATNTGDPAANGAPNTNPKVTLPITEKQPEVTSPVKSESGPTPIAYEPTNDPALDMTLEFIGNLGFGPEDPAMAAAMDGNFSLLEAKLAAMGDKAKGWEKFIALGKSAYESVQAKSKAESEKTAAAIYNIVGGEANWKAIKEWAGKNAEPEEQAVVNAAFKAGGMQAKAMAHYLATLYDGASGVNKTGRAAVTDAANSGSPTSTALSPRAYTQEVEKLRKSMGGRFEGSREYQQLQARRQAWRR